MSKKVLNWFKENPNKALDEDSDYSISVFSNDIQVGPSLLLFDGENLFFRNCDGAKNMYHLVVSKRMVDNDFAYDWLIDVKTEDITATRKEE